jgi:hypothetical protein
MKQTHYPVANPYLNNGKAILSVLLIALLLVGAGIAFLLLAKNQFQGDEQVNATIVELVRYDAFNEEACYVDYTYAGVSYTHGRLGDYSSTWYVGQVLAIYVNPKDPTQIHSVSALSTGPYLFFGFAGGMVLLSLLLEGYNLWNAQAFFPKKKSDNKVTAALVSVEPLKSHGQFRLRFSLNEKTYSSRRLKGDYPLIQQLLAQKPIVTGAYLDQKGHFAPDYPELNATLLRLKNEAGLTLAPDYRGLDPNDDGSHHF